MTLSAKFNAIIAPVETDSFQYSAIPIPKFTNHRIAKDKAGNPTLLLSIPTNQSELSFANLKLQNVSVLFDINCKIFQNKKLFEKAFTAICFIGSDSSLKNYFLRLCSMLVEDLGNAPSQEQIRKEINRFIELFRLATAPQTKTVQGLWGELFLIAESKNPAVLLKCWHVMPEEKFDFNNGEERIEVKSSSTSQRIHNFSLDQLNSPTDTETIIASVFVKQTSTGKSISSLTDEIEERIKGEVDLIEKLQLQVALALGVSILDAIKLKFDFQLAKDSLQFYKTDDVPKISFENVPPFVTDVRFKSDLSALTPIIIVTLNSRTSLFKSI